MIIVATTAGPPTSRIPRCYRIYGKVVVYGNLLFAATLYVFQGSFW